MSHGAGSFLDTTPLDQLPVAAGADVKSEIKLLVSKRGFSCTNIKRCSGSFGAQLVVAVSVPSSNRMALEHPGRKSQDTEQVKNLVR